jgi:hypothetical protein
LRQPQPEARASSWAFRPKQAGTVADLRRKSGRMCSGTWQDGMKGDVCGIFILCSAWFLCIAIYIEVRIKSFVINAFAKSAQ